MLLTGILEISNFFVGLDSVLVFIKPYLKNSGLNSVVSVVISTCTSEALLSLHLK